MPPSAVSGIPTGLGSYNPRISDGFGRDKPSRPPLPGTGFSGAQTDGRIRATESQRNVEERNDPFRESQGRRFPTGAMSPSGASSGIANESLMRASGTSMKGPSPVSQMPVATFEHGTGGYINRQAQNVEKDILDEEMKKFNF